MSNYKKRRKQARKEFQEKRREENFWKSNLIPYKSEEDMSSFKFMWLDLVSGVQKRNLIVKYPLGLLKSLVQTPLLYNKPPSCL